MLSDNIRVLRLMSGLSQESYANKLGVVRQTVSKWERGEAEPEASILGKIAIQHQITVDELMYESVEDIMLHRGGSSRVEQCLAELMDALMDEVISRAIEKMKEEENE